MNLIFEGALYLISPTYLQVYAGIAREGLSIDKLSNKYEVQPISLTTYQGINDLVTTMNPKHLEFKVNINNIILGIQKKYTRMVRLNDYKLQRFSNKLNNPNF